MNDEITFGWVFVDIKNDNWIQPNGNGSQLYKLRNLSWFHTFLLERECKGKTKNLTNHNLQERKSNPIV